MDLHTWRESGEPNVGWDAVPTFVCETCGASVLSYDIPSAGMRIKRMTDILPAWKLPYLSDTEWSSVIGRFEANFPNGATCVGALLWLAKMGVTPCGQTIEGVRA